MKAITIAAAAICVAGALASAGAAGADALSKEASEAMSGPTMYLPANPSNPGGVKGYDHGRQFDFNVEDENPAKIRALQHQFKKTMPKHAVVGQKVKSGSYKLAPVHDSGSN
ncbi:hypothetical protein [Ralstonia sp. UBA689]|uniref:hypothetical protein n=1 Tax=Ralstonia sp. UBA689 TaxID=1947373 RepID=UPI0025CC7195|nr:hypothetical protein [Ralstonia sp. UBA689]